MPATRSIRRDVILRVPKIDATSRRTSTSGRAADSEERDRVGGLPRRSTSPSKRGAASIQSEAERRQTRRKSNESGKGYEYAAQATSTAEWNSLLIWARRQRGPQWDAATGLWQVDQFSSDYYSFGNDPARNTKLSTVTTHQEEAASRADIKTLDETHLQSNDEGEGERVIESGHVLHGYGVEDSPPIGPGGRRSRAR